MTNAKWIKGEYNFIDWKDDASAILFNLSKLKSFHCKKSYGAIEYSKYYGPIFGNDKLAAIHEPFNEYKYCYSKTNERCYNIRRNSEGINMLTNQKCELNLNLCLFTIR